MKFVFDFDEMNCGAAFSFFSFHQIKQINQLFGWVWLIDEEKKRAAGPPPLIQKLKFFHGLARPARRQ